MTSIRMKISRKKSQIDSTFDAKVNSVIDVEVNNKEREDDVKLDDKSMRTAKRHDNKYAEYDSDNSTQTQVSLPLCANVSV